MAVLPGLELRRVLASITTKPDTRELKRSLEQQGYELSPECESMLELLTEDIVVGVYEAYCANAPPPMPDNNDEEGSASSMSFASVSACAPMRRPCACCPTPSSISRSALRSPLLMRVDIGNTEAGADRVALAKPLQRLSNAPDAPNECSRNPTRSSIITPP